jgi:hypothetical protein
MQLISKACPATANGEQPSATHAGRIVPIRQQGHHSVVPRVRRPAAATSHLLWFASVIAGALLQACTASAADNTNPAVTTYSAASKERVYTFLGTPNGHLDLNYWNGSAWKWTDQGVPQGTTVADAPGVVTYLQAGQQRTYAFVCTANGHLSVNYYDGSAWHWADQGVPPGTMVTDVPVEGPIVILHCKARRVEISRFWHGARGTPGSLAVNPVRSFNWRISRLFSTIARASFFDFGSTSAHAESVRQQGHARSPCKPALAGSCLVSLSRMARESR